MHVSSVLRRERDGCMFRPVIIRQENGRHARLTKREPDRERQSRAHKIISERVVMPLARLSHGMRRIFHGARFTHGFIISSPNDDEKEQTNTAPSCESSLHRSLKVLMLPKIFVKMQVRLNECPFVRTKPRCACLTCSKSVMHRYLTLLSLITIMMWSMRKMYIIISAFK